MSCVNKKLTSFFFFWCVPCQITPDVGDHYSVCNAVGCQQEQFFSTSNSHPVVDVSQPWHPYLRPFTIFCKHHMSIISQNMTKAGFGISSRITLTLLRTPSFISIATQFTCSILRLTHISCTSRRLRDNLLIQYFYSVLPYCPKEHLTVLRWIINYIFSLH